MWRFYYDNWSIIRWLVLAQGRSRQAIAKALFISEGTVKTHASNIYKMFGVASKDRLLEKVEELKEEVAAKR